MSQWVFKQSCSYAYSCVCVSATPPVGRNVIDGKKRLLLGKIHAVDIIPTQARYLRRADSDIGRKR